LWLQYKPPATIIILMNEVDKLAQIIWGYHLMHQRVEKADLILGLGCNDARIADRAAGLWLADHAPLLMFSGGHGRLTPEHWGKPEAEFFAARAEDLGVPRSSIFVENKSSNTSENIIFSRNQIEKKGLLVKKVIFVHVPYMERRVYATVKKVWPEIDFVVASPQIALSNYPTEQITKEATINMLMGYLQRIRIYSEKGFQIPQDIPGDVWDAYEKLITLGYIRELVES